MNSHIGATAAEVLRGSYEAAAAFDEELVDESDFFEPLSLEELEEFEEPDELEESAELEEELLDDDVLALDLLDSDRESLR